MRTVTRWTWGTWLLAAALPLAACGAAQPAVAVGGDPAPAACEPAVARPPVDTTAPPAGTLLVAGGGPLPAALAERFVALAGGPGRARIVVFPMASAVAEAGPEKAAELRALGAEATSLPLDRAAASCEAAVRAVEAATGIWFVGGSQERITAALLGTPVERALHARHRAGAAIGGTSAGAAVMSARMITGDERRPGGARPDTTQAWITIDRDNVVTAPGLGLLRGAIVDQHFVRRRRHNRLLSLVLELPERLGVGIDESTALEIGPDGVWRVLGAGTAVVYDARAARVTGADASALGAADVRLHVLPAGATFDPATGRAGMP